MATEERHQDRQIAVLIDYENVGLQPISWLFDQISDVGRVIIKRAYADWSTPNKNRNILLELGIEPIQLFRAPDGGKNSSDIRLAMDAIELLYSSPVDTYVIVSSDSDFVPLASKLRAAGKLVFGAGDPDKVTPTLVKSCDRFFYFEQTKGSDTVAKKNIMDFSAKTSLLKRAAQASIDENGKVYCSKLHQTILNLDPSFNYRALGYSTFTKFLAQLLKQSIEYKLVKPKGPGDYYIQVIE